MYLQSEKCFRFYSIHFKNVRLLLLKRPLFVFEKGPSEREFRHSKMNEVRERLTRSCPLLLLPCSSVLLLSVVVVVVRVRKPINCANPGLNINQMFLFLLLKSISQHCLFNRSLKTTKVKFRTKRINRESIWFSHKTGFKIDAILGLT